MTPLSLQFNSRGPITFPTVTGHEITGIVEEVGNAVTKFKVGDIVGVGCFVDSCRSCDNCAKDLGNYCRTGMVGTYNSKFKYAHSPEYTAEGGNRTQGMTLTLIIHMYTYTVYYTHNI